MGKIKKITLMTNNQAKKFLLKGSSYCNLELPSYFNFDKIISNIVKKVNSRDMHSFYDDKIKPRNVENVNYKILSNKDGNYAWRPFEIVHPYLYIELVEKICEEENWNIIKKRFKDFSDIRTIKCCSIPVESCTKASDKKEGILNWWNKFEQEIISKSLDFKYMACTDILNCYPSIYTHSISWAIHTIDEAKKKKNDEKLLGNIIDKQITNMQYGQTNGIPQGSILMDFIAEIVLGYGDELLFNELNNNNINNYYILRYRDDYRIFTNNSHDIDLILKIITEVLGKLNFKINSAKTFITNDIITNSIKKDKMYCLQNPIEKKLNLQKKIILIRNIGIKYPNSGSILKQLTELYRTDIKKMKKKPNDCDQLISIIVDIMYNSPRTFPICSAILSKFLYFLDDSDVKKYIKRIIIKFNSMPNTDYLNIWLQRITIPLKRNLKYSKTLICEKVYKDNNIWNSTWLKSIIIDEKTIIDEKIISNLNSVISIDEVDKFNNYNI